MSLETPHFVACAMYTRTREKRKLHETRKRIHMKNLLVNVVITENAVVVV